jgi:transcriptional regulator with XRE-family HTH domain
MVHKKILEAAAENPDATMDELADGVVGASTDLVERVLDEYGDPATAGETAGSGGETAAGVADTAQSEDTFDESGSGAGELGSEQRGTDASADRATGQSETETTGADAGTSGDDPADRESNGDESNMDEATPSDTTDRADASTVEADVEETGEERDASAVETDVADRDEPMAAEDIGEIQTTTVGDDTAVDGTTGSGSTPVAPETTDSPEAEALSRKELAVLEAIAEHPAATQAELAEELGVSRATISKRANGIEGFEWRHRDRFVAQTLGTDPRFEAQRAVSDGGSETTGGDAESPENRLVGETDAVTDTATDGDAADPASEPSGSVPELGNEDPRLVHKVLRTCMESDRFEQEEEVRLVAAMLGSD